MPASLDQAFSFPFNDIKSLAPVENERSCTNMMRHMRACQHCRAKLQYLIQSEITQTPHPQMDHRNNPPRYSGLPFNLNKKKLIKLLIIVIIILIVLPLCIRASNGNVSFLG